MSQSRLSNNYKDNYKDKCACCSGDLIVGVKITTDKDEELCVICFQLVYNFSLNLTHNDKRFLKTLGINPLD